MLSTAPQILLLVLAAIDMIRALASSSRPLITFVTGNANKLAEVQQSLADRGPLAVDWTNAVMDLPELQGEPVDIAIQKCRMAAERIKGPCLTEDTSLCLDALGGLPGPYIKWFLDKCGHDGLNRMLDGFEDRSASAVTLVALTMGENQKVLVFRGQTDGRIVAARGPTDFGWDPIFEPLEGGGKTYAEMSKEEKNAISHRGRALAKLHEYLSEL